MPEIYEILDPRDGAVRYIGKANDARKRFAGHMRETRRRTPLYDWMAKMRKAGLTPSYRVAVVCAPEDWAECEIKAIAAARASGAKLLNLADGGNEPYCSIEQRSINAKQLNAKRKADPAAEFLHYARRTLAQAAKDGRLSERAKGMMRQCIQKRPDLFGNWVGLV